MYKYIVIEGIHGAGKSSVAQALAAKLCAVGYDATYYHFPEEKELFGQLIREVLTEKDVYAHREVTGLLYAAFANKFHIKNKQSDTVFVVDRHSVTTGLIFQQDMPMEVRKEIYKFGIEALQQEGIMIYLDIDKETAKQRKETRNAVLAKEGKVWQDKSNDNFNTADFEKMTALYASYLVPAVQSLGIQTATVANNGAIEETVDKIYNYVY